MRTIASITQELNISTEQGLSSAQISQSKQKYGVNQLTPLPREPIWKKFLEKFDEPIIKILLAAALLSMVVDLFKANNLLGGIGVGLVVVLVAAAYVLRLSQWIPSILFGTAIVLFFMGLFSGHL